MEPKVELIIDYVMLGMGSVSHHHHRRSGIIRTFLRREESKQKTKGSSTMTFPTTPVRPSGHATYAVPQLTWPRSGFRIGSTFLIVSKVNGS